MSDARISVCVKSFDGGRALGSPIEDGSADESSVTRQGSSKDGRCIFKDLFKVKENFWELAKSGTFRT